MEPTNIIVLMTFVSILYFISRKISKGEEREFYNENDIATEPVDIGNVDEYNEVVISFKFKQKTGQFLFTSQPNLILNQTEKHKMTQGGLTLKVPASFTLHFGVPYMDREVFTVTKSFILDAGYKYVMTFKARIFIFQKPKVIIEQIGRIE